MSIEDDIVNEAKKWLGVKYKHAGRDRFGLDCAGLIMRVMNDLGFNDYNPTNYPKRPTGDDFVKAIKSFLYVVPNDQLGHGTVGVFREPYHPCHTGIMEVDSMGQRWMIHAYAPARKVVRESYTPSRHERLFMVAKFTVPEGR